MLFQNFPFNFFTWASSRGAFAPNKAKNILIIIVHMTFYREKAGGYSKIIDIVVANVQNVK